jgi:hypothetical protein
VAETYVIAERRMDNVALVRLDRTKAAAFWAGGRAAFVGR